MTSFPVKFWIRAAIVMVGLLAGPIPQSAIAQTVTVPSSSYPTIQAAINAVPSGTTINVLAGTYNEALVVSPSPRSFTVRGVSGAGSTFVNAAGRGAPALTIDRATGQIAFIGLTFRNGAPASAAGGGFVITASSPSFTNCIFEANTASAGAGGAILSSSPTFTGCTIRNNSARGSGGGVLILSGSRPVFTNCDIVGNASGTTDPIGVGGGVDSRNSSPTFRGSRINGNTSKFAGGGIYHGGAFGSPYGTSMLVLEDSDVADNITSPFSSAFNPGEGGGIHIEDNAIATLTRVRVLRNRANTGGGLNAFRARYDVVDSVIDANQAMARTDGGVPGGLGGGINAMSQNPAPSTGPVSMVNLTGTLVRNNVGVTGGGIVVTGDANLQATLTLASSVVDKNQAQNQGGGILVSHAGLTANNSMIIRNNVSTVPGAGGQVGGGIDITTFSSATLNGTTIAHNSAGTFGGGIFLFGGSNTLNMNASYIYENTAGVRGGGLFVDGTSQSGTIQNSIIADNSSAQINEESCSSVLYQSNTITPKSGTTNFSGCPPGSRQTGTNSGLPRFNRFLAVPRAGTTSTLVWSVARATSVSIDGVGGWTSPNNSPTGTVDVTPTSSTTYIMTATATPGNGGNYGGVTAGFTSVQPPPPPPPPPTAHIVDGDFDGDGKADITVFRPSNGTWYLRYTGTGATTGFQWGNGLDKPVPGDYDGDRKTDIAVFRPSDGTWYLRYTGTGATTGFQWGSGSDKPVPGDYDGDGKTDFAVFRPSDGTWYLRYSSTGATAGFQWGNGSDVPSPGDYDGDGKTDIAVFRPSNGTWYLRYTATGMTTGFQWGGGSDVPSPGDYDGDGKTDIAVFRPSNGTWYLRYTGTGSTAGFQWGGGSDVPVPGDYNGDGKTDIAVFRPSNGTWYLRYSGTGTTAGFQWGNGSDVPILKRP